MAAGIFYSLDVTRESINDPMTMVKPGIWEMIANRQMENYVLSEVCALDMMYAITGMAGGLYRTGLVLKGGMSVRNYVPVAEHRISFDLDFNPNSAAGYSYGKVSRIKRDLERHGSAKGCTTRARVTNNSAMLYFLEITYRDALREIGATTMEPTKVEICKTCRTRTEPILNEVNTIIDTAVFGRKPPKVLQMSLEEQLADKLRVIGAQGRQRNNFDAYDAYRITRHNKVDWKKARRIFEEMVAKSNKRPSEYVEHCTRHLDSMLGNPNKRKSLERVMFAEPLDFEAMIRAVKSLYRFEAGEEYARPYGR